MRHRHPLHPWPRLPASPPCRVRSFDIRFVQAKADAIELLAEFADPPRSKPMFLFMKGGAEKARLEGANPIELGKLVTKLAQKKAAGAA